MASLAEEERFRVGIRMFGARMASTCSSPSPHWRECRPAMEGRVRDALWRDRRMSQRQMAW